MTTRVLLFTNIYPSRQYLANGIWILEQVRSLKQKGLEFDVVHFNPRDTRLNYLVGLVKLVKRIRTRQHHILHTHDIYTFYLACLARVLAAVPLRIVLTIHEEDILKPPCKEGRERTVSPLRLLRRSIRLTRSAAAKADFVIFVCREQMEMFPLIPSDVIPCGVDLDRFRPLEKAMCRRQLGIPTNAILVFFPKAAQFARHNVSLAREAHKILCGRERGNAILIPGGTIPHDQMPLYYNASDVVLQTSLNEASPTIVKEALACEVPIVSTDVGDTREMVEGVPYCFVCNDDAGILADHLQMALGHRAVGGRDRIREKGLALDQVADRVIRVYDRVLLKTASAAEVI